MSGGALRHSMHSFLCSSYCVFLVCVSASLLDFLLSFLHLRYCPAGSSAPVVAKPGEYTLGPTPLTRNSTAPCGSGTYCVNGTARPCPAGRFGCADRLGDVGCNGPCTGGFYCPLASSSSQAFACGGNDSARDAAAFYCPVGSGAPLAVGAGSYSTGSSLTSPHQRTGQEVCSPGTYCVLGVQVRQLVVHAS